MPDFLGSEQDKYQQDPQMEAVHYLKEIYEYIKRIADDVNRMKEDVDKMHQKMK
ncbi:hypothetical protein KC614_00260 [candidate division WWE3 bacterium]|uniref:Uncharacterized protein n=1 Tax=candidate division WWE3 bacterium TaxID=2053526 RepID=A0A955LJR7_UNCKA|nr:hypothetical protein [candidate division WWE3 bacterium]